MGEPLSAPGGIVFLGTSDFAVESLKALDESGERIALVVTQPDRPAGRGRILSAPPVKRTALALGLAVAQPENVNADETVARLRELAPEFLVVVAYGQILRRALLDVPARGAVNLHASLLPRHRGPSPVAWTILSGDLLAGNTSMLMEEGLDSGPILLQDSEPISPADTRGDLERRLSVQGARLLAETLARLRKGGVAIQPQESERATWSRLLTADMRPIDWSRPSAEIRRQIHALSPVPSAWGRVKGRAVKVLRVREAEAAGIPGTVLACEEDGPLVACGQGAVVLTEVQPDGKRAMTGADFLRGGGVRAGDHWECSAP